MWNTVLFDLDGTLSDSAPGITRCVQYALEKEFGIIRKPEELIEFVGPPLKEQFMLYTGCNDEMGERAVARYRERYRPVGIFENSLYPGIPELLLQLKNEGFRIALSSSKPEEFCHQILETFEIAQYFDVVCGSDMEGRHTDKAEIVEEVLHRLGMENRREEVVLVGDRKYDIIGARQRGVGTIGVSYGYGSREELELEWPDCIVDTVTELRNVLIGQARAGRRNENTANTPAGIAERKRSDGGLIYKVWRIVYPMLLHFAVVNITAVLVLAGYLVIRILTGGAPYDAFETIQSEMLILTGLGDAILIPIAWMFYREDEKKRLSKGFRERILVHNTFEISEIVSVAIMVIGISCLMNLLIALIPIDDVEYQEIAEEMFKNNGIVIQLVVIGILAPVSEELIFRGLIFRRSRDYVGFMWAAVCSGLFFGIYHGNLTQGIFAFFMGMLFAAIYEHFGTLWASIVAHMANNIFATLENNLLDKIDVPDIAYFIFVIVIGAAGIALMYRILAGGKRVNEI